MFRILLTLKTISAGKKNQIRRKTHIRRKKKEKEIYRKEKRKKEKKNRKKEKREKEQKKGKKRKRK